MSSVGWAVVLHIDARERQDRERREQILWGETYAHRLHPDEIEFIRSGKRATFTRPVPPAWAKGHWLEAGPKMRVRIKEVRFVRRRTYLIIVDKIEDFRGGGRLIHRQIRQEIVDDPTIAHAASRVAPEADKVPAHIVSSLKSSIEARARYAEHQDEQTCRRIRRSLVEELRRDNFTAAELAVVQAAVDAVHRARRVAA